MTKHLAYAPALLLGLLLAACGGIATWEAGRRGPWARRGPRDRRRPNVDDRGRRRGRRQHDDAAAGRRSHPASTAAGPASSCRTQRPCRRTPPAPHRRRLHAAAVEAPDAAAPRRVHVGPALPIPRLLRVNALHLGELDLRRMPANERERRRLWPNHHGEQRLGRLQRPIHQLWGVPGEHRREHRRGKLRKPNERLVRVRRSRVPGRLRRCGQQLRRVRVEQRLRQRHHERELQQ